MSPGIVLNINKPKGITSFSVVRHVRKITDEKKVGHAGTLDPFATGVLLVLVGRGATKRMKEFMRLRKQYRATLRFGLMTDTHDIDGTVEQDNEVRVSPKEVQSLARDFTGEIVQVPPMYSAKKFDGKPLYKYAREGKSVKRDPTRVTIHDITIGPVDGRDVTLDIACSKGTYIRALARDMGALTGTGVAVTKLECTAVGDYTVEAALPLNELGERWNSIVA
ncbi:MAG: tRNA pseudouridine(55) synthase TruB [Candidatus Marinimicrobia bacterium]|nr:tRNA pseudouridine(55) synthase TruB [Candidatus Neomarinimicrobiota bacterium]MCF7880627.1 tRNA pseudouridine(55) synthase TruB [Candidatus Neomarinimicrobiota bacterium]